eukprot:3016652-Pyramimonas_sp.AAC.1
MCGACCAKGDDGSHLRRNSSPSLPAVSRNTTVQCVSCRVDVKRADNARMIVLRKSCDVNTARVSTHSSLVAMAPAYSLPVGTRPSRG